ncbi:MAG: hypothetical protein QXN36_01440 [Candidatus Bathyarchaeia archaeon]
MQSKLGYRFTAFAVVSMFFLLLISYAAPTANYNSHSDDSKSTFTFFEDYEGWIPKGYERYSEFSINASLTAEIVVGVGEEYENIQEALDAGFSCIYLKKQKFYVTESIIPLKEDFYIISDGAEIVAVEPMLAIFDIRNVRYAHLDGLFINGNGLAEKCIDAMRMPSQVPVHQIRNCKIWGAKFANIDLTGCEDTLLFNCWIDGRITNDASDTVTEYGVKIGDAGEGYRTGGQINLIHCLFGFHRKADVYAKNVAELKLANCLLASKSVWSDELEAHIVVGGGTGENALLPVLELTNCWVENGLGDDAPNILVRNRMISKLTVVGGMFYTDNSPNIYSQLNPCAETITLIGALFENNFNYDGFNVVAPTQKLVSIGNTYNWHGIDKTNVVTYLIFDKDDVQIETNITNQTNES